MHLGSEGQWLSCPPGVGCSNVAGIEVAATFTGFHDTSGVNHVFYSGCDLTVYEEYQFNGQWFVHSLGGAPGDSIFGQGLTSCWDGTQEHVYFLTPVPQQLTFPVNGTWAQSAVPGTTFGGFLTAVCSATVSLSLTSSVAESPMSGLGISPAALAGN